MVTLSILKDNNDDYLRTFLAKQSKAASTLTCIRSSCDIFRWSHFNQQDERWIPRGPQNDIIFNDDGYGGRKIFIHNMVNCVCAQRKVFEYFVCIIN